MSEKQRTLTQNAALHLWFEHVATELNDAGMDIQKTLRKDVEIPWSKHTVKELMWKEIQKAVVGARSTRRLKKMEVDDVFNVMNRHLGEKLGIHVPFPSIESLNAKQ